MLGNTTLTSFTSVLASLTLSYLEKYIQKRFFTPFLYYGNKKVPDFL